MAAAEEEDAAPATARVQSGRSRGGGPAEACGSQQHPHTEKQELKIIQYRAASGGGILAGCEISRCVPDDGGVCRGGG